MVLALFYVVAIQPCCHFPFLNRKGATAIKSVHSGSKNKTILQKPKIDLLLPPYIFVI
jgi:hypothetical protein